MYNFNLSADSDQPALIRLQTDSSHPAHNPPLHDLSLFRRRLIKEFGWHHHLHRFSRPVPPLWFLSESVAFLKFVASSEFLVFPLVS